MAAQTATKPVGGLPAEIDDATRTWLAQCIAEDYKARVTPPDDPKGLPVWEGPKDAPVWLGYPFVGEAQTLASLTIDGEGEVPLRLIAPDKPTRCGIYVREGAKMVQGGGDKARRAHNEPAGGLKVNMVSKDTLRALEEAGFGTFAAIAEAADEDLQEVPGVDERVLGLLRRAAEANK